MIQSASAGFLRAYWPGLAAAALLFGLTLALWAVYGPSVFAEMAAGFMAFCF